MTAPAGLTPSDRHHLAALQAHWRQHRAFPSLAKLASVVGLRSPAGVFALVGRLADAGYLQRVDGRIAPTSRFFGRELLDCPAGRAPRDASAAPHPHLLSIDDYLVSRPERTCLVVVHGEAMSEAGLLDGDIAVVERHAPTRPGDLVAARVNGTVTVRRLACVDGRYVLHAAGAVAAPLESGVEFELVGVVTGLFRTFDRPPASALDDRT